MLDFVIIGVVVVLIAISATIMIKRKKSGESSCGSSCSSCASSCPSKK